MPATCGREARTGTREKEQEQERIEQMQELYDDAREALDDGKYQEAEKKFAELAQMNGHRPDAALYWKAYSENQAENGTRHWRRSPT